MPSSLPCLPLAFNDTGSSLQDPANHSSSWIFSNGLVTASKQDLHILNFSLASFFPDCRTRLFANDGNKEDTTLTSSSPQRRCCPSLKTLHCSTSSSFAPLNAALPHARILHHLPPDAGCHVILHHHRYLNHHHSSLFY